MFDKPGNQAEKQVPGQQDPGVRVTITVSSLP